MNQSFTNNCSTVFIQATYAILPTFNIISSLAIVFGNSAVLHAIYSTARLRTVSNYFLCSLSTADLLVGIVMNPVYVAVFFLQAQSDTHPLRVAEHWLWIQSVVSSTFTLCAVTVERYVAIKFVFRYEHLVTVRRCIYSVVFIWTFSFIFASVRIVVTDPSDLPKLWTVTTVIGVLLPLAIISYCNLHIALEARKHVNHIVSQCQTNPSLAVTMAKNKKAAHTVGIVVLLFVLLWSPSLVLSLVDVSTGNPCSRENIVFVWFWAAFVSFLSSALNPLVYSVRNREIRSAIFRNFRRSCCQKYTNGSQN